MEKKCLLVGRDDSLTLDIVVLGQKGPGRAFIWGLDSLGGTCVLGTEDGKRWAGRCKSLQRSLGTGAEASHLSGCDTLVTGRAASGTKTTSPPG
jgi:hypothetical protein